ncbi:MAG: hypothetical protein EAZ89_10530, partial [Bacteroidetes bacterium]
MHIGVLADPAHFHTRKWVKGLQQAGAQVTVFSFSASQSDQCRCVRIVPSAAPGGRLTYASFLLSGSQLRKALIRERIDILNPIDITPYGVWAARSGFGPIAAIAMGADILEYPPRRSQRIAPAHRLWSSERSRETSPFSDWTRWLFFRNMVSYALGRAALVSGDNLQLTHALRDWFQVPESKILLNRWGIEPELFVPDPARQAWLRMQMGIQPGDRVVLAPRGLRPVYQGDVILEGLSKWLASDDFRAKVIVLGAGYAAPAETRTAAMQLALRDARFHLETEALAREDMCQLWLMTDLFINAPVYDGYSNALSEGRYVGALPLLNDIPAHREILEFGTHALCADPFTAEQLAAILPDTLRNMDAWKARVAPA